MQNARNPGIQWCARRHRIQAEAAQQLHALGLPAAIQFSLRGGRGQGGRGFDFPVENAIDLLVAAQIERGEEVVIIQASGDCFERILSLVPGNNLAQGQERDGVGVHKIHHDRRGQN